MVLNVWSAKWNGRLIEVRNHCFVAELMVDGKLIDRVPALFRHDLRGKFIGSKVPQPTRVCSHADCKHPNKPGAKFCANCGAELPDRGRPHDVYATVEFRFPPPRVNCRVFVDGDELFKES